MFNTPILFLIFNRLDKTKIVFEKIREAQPTQLFIAADGARDYKEGEHEICDEVRQWVISNVDWECELITRFQEENLGCGKHVSSAISWFFENVEYGIILEDDCVPNNSFFTFCAELLEKYKNNEEICVVCGNNYQSKPRGKASYYFSAYVHIWGWATWRRAWKNYDFTMNSFDDELMEEKIKSYFSKKQAQKYWLKIFKIMKYDPIDTWDYQWVFTQWHNNGISIIPNKNLVTNIGFDATGTHTKKEVEGMSNRPTEELKPIILHPNKIKINKRADLYSFYNHYEAKKKSDLPAKVRDKIKCEFRKLIKRNNN